MNLVALDIISGKNGEVTEFWINPEHVVMLLEMNVPGKFKDAQGNPIMENKTGIDMGNKILLTNLNINELKEKLMIYPVGRKQVPGAL